MSLSICLSMASSIRYCMALSIGRMWYSRLADYEPHPMHHFIRLTVHQRKWMAPSTDLGHGSILPWLQQYSIATASLIAHCRVFINNHGRHQWHQRWPYWLTASWFSPVATTTTSAGSGVVIYQCKSQLERRHVMLKMTPFGSTLDGLINSPWSWLHPQFFAMAPACRGFTGRPLLWLQR